MTDVEVVSAVGLKASFTVCENVDVRMERTIGKGVSGLVALAHHSENRDQKKAMKFFTNKAMSASFYTEVAILQHVNHKHIMSNIQAYETPVYQAISMPYYPRGTLRRHLRRLTLASTRKYFIHLASAVYYLNKRRIVHRDIKPDNVLLSEDDQAVLTDFGHSHVLNTRVHGIACSEGYRPPEMDNLSKKSFDYYKCDSYALGVTLWNMAGRTHDTCRGQCLHCICSYVQNPSIFTFLIQRFCHHDMYKRWSVECMVAKKSEYPMLEELLGGWAWHSCFQ